MAWVIVSCSCIVSQVAWCRSCLSCSPIYTRATWELDPHHTPTIGTWDTTLVRGEQDHTTPPPQAPGTPHGYGGTGPHHTHITGTWDTTQVHCKKCGVSEHPSGRGAIFYCFRGNSYCYRTPLGHHTGTGEQDHSTGRQNSHHTPNHRHLEHDAGAGNTPCTPHHRHLTHPIHTYTIG